MSGWSFKDNEIKLTSMTLNLTGGQTILEATGTGAAGTATCAMPLQGDDLKVVVVYFNGYKQTDSTGQTYTFPVAFKAAPAKLADATSNGCTITASSITFPASMGSAVSGWLVLAGF